MNVVTDKISLQLTILWTDILPLCAAAYLWYFTWDTALFEIPLQFDPEVREWIVRTFPLQPKHSEETLITLSHYNNIPRCLLHQK